MYNKILSILNSFRNSACDPITLAKLEEIDLTERASDLYETLNSLVLEGTGSMIIKFNQDLIGVEGYNLKRALEEGRDTINVFKYTESGYRDTQFDVEVDAIIDQLACEFEVADLENRIIRTLSTMSDDLSIGALTSSINSILSRTITPSGAALAELLNQLLVTCPDAKTFKTAFFSLAVPEPNSLIFTTPTIGEVTNTSGLALWMHDAVESVLGAITSIRIDFAGVASRAYQHYVDSQYLNASLTLIGLKRIGYFISDIFQDSWISFTGDRADSLAVDNGFVDLGLANTELSNLAISKGLTTSEAFALPTIGATFYLFYKDDNIHIGLQKHIYDKDSADLLYKRISASGNDWADVADMFTSTHNPIVKPLKKGDGVNFANVNAYNNYVASSMAATERLISFGLLLIGNEDSIVNRYYQSEVASDNYFVYGWIPTFDGSSSWSYVDSAIPNTRLELAQHLTNVSSSVSSTMLSFAQLQLINYLRDFDNGNVCAAHVPVRQCIQGYTEFNDDALLKAQIVTSVQNVVTGALIITGIIATTLAVVKLKGAARTAAVQAQRAIFDASIPVAEAKAAIRKANRLSVVAGVSAPSLISAFASSPVLQPFSTDLDPIIKLIRS